MLTLVPKRAVSVLLLGTASGREPDNAGGTDTFRRLTRTEYQNAIRDLLALDVDVAELLPRDDASFGFDNVGAVGLSPAWRT